VYSTYQAYFSLSPEILLNHVARAKKEGFVLGAKIVRGAYLDHERNHGSMTICDNINETHMNYNRMTRAAIEHMEAVSLIAATHNKESVKYIQKLMLDGGIENDDPSISFAQLYGVGDELTEEIRSSGHRVLKYVPYGPYSETIPYLFRRIKENVDIVSKI
jgi:proline dehydrogenase